MKIISVRTEDAKAASPLLPQEVTEALKADLPVTAFVAVEGNLAVGTIAGAVDEGVFELVSIYVHPDHRGRGVGTALFDRLNALLEGEGMPIRAEFTAQDEEDELLEMFLRDRGFEEDEEMPPCWNVGYLRDLSVHDPLSSAGTADIRSFDDVPEDILRAASRQDIYIPEGGLASPAIDRRLSSLTLLEGRIAAYLAVEVQSDDLINISGLYSSLADPRLTFKMISRTAMELVKSFSPDTKIAMLSAGNTAQKLIEKLFYITENRTKRFYRT